MPGCAAPNCSSQQKKGFRVFRFPRDPARRKIWVINCRRDKWEPTLHSVLCELHFEENQYETHRLDGRKKLKPNAVPTIFNISKPPKLSAAKTVSRYKIVKKSIGEESANNGLCPDIHNAEDLKKIEALEMRVAALQKENTVLRNRIREIFKLRPHYFTSKETGKLVN